MVKKLNEWGNVFGSDSNWHGNAKHCGGEEMFPGSGIYFVFYNTIADPSVVWRHTNDNGDVVEDWYNANDVDEYIYNYYIEGGEECPEDYEEADFINAFYDLTPDFTTDKWGNYYKEEDDDDYFENRKLKSKKSKSIREAKKMRIENRKLNENKKRKTAKVESRRKLTEGASNYEYSDLIDNLAERATDCYDGDATEAIWTAIDDGLIYYDDQLTALYGTGLISEAIDAVSDAFYERLFSDIYEAMDIEE